MKVLVTGGSGFIGGYVAEYLAEENIKNEVIVFDIIPPNFRIYDNVQYVYGDIRDRRLLDRWIDGCDEVYNFAGLLGTMELNSYICPAIQTNIVGTANVIDSCLLNKVRRIMHPTKPSFRVGDDKQWENAYTLTKFGSEYVCNLYKEKHGAKISLLRFLNAVGPRQHTYPVRKVFPVLCIMALANIDLEIYGDGEQTIDVIDVRDMAEISVMVCRNKVLLNKQVVCDCGTGVKITINELAHKILKYTKSKSKIKYLPMREGEVKNINIVADTTNIKKYFPDWKPKYSIDDTIKNAIPYYKGLQDRDVCNMLKYYGHIIKGDKD